MVKEDVETVIDRLLAYVQTNKEATLSSAASAMALPPAQVEKLALLLEESGLLTVKYGLGSTKLVSKEYSEAQAAKAKKKIEARKDEVIMESEAAEREVMTAETLLAFIERDVSRRLSIAEKLLADVEKKEGEYSHEDYEFLEKELAVILQQAAMFEDEVAKLKAREAELRSLVTEFQKRLEAIRDKIPAAAQPPTRRGLRGILQRIIAVLAALLAKIRAATRTKPAVATATTLPTQATQEPQAKAKQEEKVEAAVAIVTPKSRIKTASEAGLEVERGAARRAKQALERVESAFETLKTRIKTPRQAPPPVPAFKQKPAQAPPSAKAKTLAKTQLKSVVKPPKAQGGEARSAVKKKR
ncbi:MAG: hypothetical protein QW343_01505 [Candidatus Norongarragalinales archaeon]